MDDLSQGSVVIERTFAASLEMVWQMWTVPEYFKSWYGPMGATIPVAKMDVRVGGARLVCMEMQTADGPMQMWFAGEYLEVVEPQRLVYTEAVVASGKVEKNPAMEALRNHPRNFFVVLGARMAENGLGYFFPVFGLSYVITTLGVPRSEALSALMLAFTIELFAILGFAALSDRIGRRPVYMFGALSGVALAFPFFLMVGTKEWIWIAVAFSQKVRSACMTLGRAVGKATPSTRPAASQVTSRGLAGSPVERAPNSSMTLGETYPEPEVVAS